MIPGEFIPIIEQTALSRDITEWVVTAALTQLATWRAEGSDLTLSVNISAANLDEDDFSSRLIAMARQSNVPPQALELELTESAIIRNGHSALEQMNALRAAGFRIAIDDFGTGYSSLSYLEKIPTNAVKIDRSFVQDLGTLDRSVTVVGAMISLIRSLGFRAVAEGVETQQAYDTLLRLGCDEAQGYLISRPLPPQGFQDWLQHAGCSKRLSA